MKYTINLKNNTELFSSSFVITETNNNYYHNVTEPNGKINHSARPSPLNLIGDGNKYGNKRGSLITEQLEDAKKIIENIRLRKEFNLEKYFHGIKGNAVKSEKSSIGSINNLDKYNNNKQSLKNSYKKPNKKNTSYTDSVMDKSNFFLKEEKNINLENKGHKNNLIDNRDLKGNYFEKINKKPKSYIEMQYAKLGMDQKNYNNNKFQSIPYDPNNKTEDFSSTIIKGDETPVNNTKITQYAQNDIKKSIIYDKEHHQDSSKSKRNKTIIYGNIRNRSNNHSYMEKYIIKNGNHNNNSDKGYNNKNIKNPFDTQHKLEKTYANISSETYNQKEKAKKDIDNNTLNNKLKSLFMLNREGETINFSFDDFSIDNKILKNELYLRKKEKILTLLQKIFEKEKFFLHKINETYFNCLEEDIKNKLIKILLLLLLT